MSIEQEGVRRRGRPPRVREEGHAEGETEISAARFAEAAQGGEPTDVEAVRNAAESVPNAKLPAGWFDMADAPDCRLIAVIGPNGELAEAIWRNSRRIDRRNGKWQPWGGWAYANSGGLALPFSPIGWRPGNALA